MYPNVRFTSYRTIPSPAHFYNESLSATCLVGEPILLLSDTNDTLQQYELSL